MPSSKTFLAKGAVICYRCCENESGKEKCDALLKCFPPEIEIKKVEKPKLRARLGKRPVAPRGGRAV